MNKNYLLIFLALCLLLTGCAKPPQPSNTENICSIFEQYPEWYWDAKRCEKKWGVPVPVQMSIINQESSFNAKAQPRGKKILWIFPGKPRSTAYGYTQALKSTWGDYQRENKSTAHRSGFSDATDFVGWYAHKARKRAKISITNPYQLYLAYHEGAGGYAKKSYLAKPWLIKTAHKVRARSDTYARQLARCEKNIPKTGWWKF